MTVKQIEDEYSKDPKKLNKRVPLSFYKYCDIFDALYHCLLLESRDLEELIQFALGFLVLWEFMKAPGSP